MEATTKTLDGLPSELICNISARLHADDVSAFRLASRSLEQKSFHEFATEYFSEKCFMFTTESLKVLVEIAKSARLSPFLRHVHFMTAIFSDRAFQCVHGCNCTWQPSIRQKEAFRDYVKDQNMLKQTGRDRDMLCEAFAKVPSLTTLSVDDSPSMLGPDIDYRGNNKVPRLCGRPPMLAPHAASKDAFKEYDAFFQHVWEVVMQSVQHSPSITNFATYLSKSSNGVPIALLDTKAFPNSIPMLNGLTTLLLRIRSYKRSGCTEDKRAKDVSKRELNTLLRFATTLSSLEVLDLAFDSTKATGQYLVAFTAGLDMSIVTKCFLDGIAISESHLGRIISSMTLVKDLRLIFTNLTKGSWVTILKLLQTMTQHIKHLHLMYLLERGCKVYFLKQIEEHGLDPFGYGDDAFDDDDDDADEGDTDDDLPPMEPFDVSVADLNLHIANEQHHNAPDGLAIASTAPNGSNAIAASPGPETTLDTVDHSDFNHVRPGDEDSGEQGYFVCVQGKEIERQLPIFIQEYNLGVDVVEDPLAPGLGVVPGLGIGGPGTGGSNFNNFMTALGAALGVPGVPPPTATGAGVNLGGAGAAATAAAGSHGGTSTLPFHLPAFGAAASSNTTTPTTTPTISNSNSNSNAPPAANSSLANPISSSNPPPAPGAGSATSATNLPGIAAVTDEWEDEEENDDMD